MLEVFRDLTVHFKSAPKKTDLWNGIGLLDGVGQPFVRAELVIFKSQKCQKIKPNFVFLAV